MRHGHHQVLGHPDPITYTPKTELGKRLQKNAKWLYHNGARDWAGYKTAVPRYSLAVLFSSFLMGEIVAATIFHQMAAGCTEPGVQGSLPHIGKDEGRHMGICLALMERDYPKIAVEDRALITKQIRAGYLFLSAVLFEPPMEFSDLPDDFIQNQRDGETVGTQRWFCHSRVRGQENNWRTAILTSRARWTSMTSPSLRSPRWASPARKCSDVDLDDIIPVFSTVPLFQNFAKPPDPPHQAVPLRQTVACDTGQTVLKPSNVQASLPKLPRWRLR